MTTDTKSDATAGRSAASQGVQPVTPHLVCAGAAKAIEFYRQAFGATEMFVLPMADGRIMHASLSINGGSVMLVDEFPEMGSEMSGKAPSTLGSTTVTIHLTVDDADAWIERAAAAGATVVMPAADMFWGDRYGVIRDPFGHSWSIATPQRALSEAEIRAAAAEAMAGTARP